MKKIDSSNLYKQIDKYISELSSKHDVPKHWISIEREFNSIVFYCNDPSLPCKQKLEVIK